MNKPLIVMPIKVGQIIKNEVLQGITSQTIPCNIFVHSHDAYVNNFVREYNININRYYTQQSIRKLKLNPDDYIILLDSDVIMQPNTVEELIKEINSCNYVAIAAKTKDEYESIDHVIMACAIIKYKDYEVIRYLDNLEDCQCKKISMIGPVKYLNNIQLREIER